MADPAERARALLEIFESGAQRPERLTNHDKTMRLLAAAQAEALLAVAGRLDALLAHLEDRSISIRDAGRV